MATGGRPDCVNHLARALRSAGKQPRKRDRFLVPVVRHGNPVLFRTHVDTSGITVHDRERTGAGLLWWYNLVFSPYCFIG